MLGLLYGYLDGMLALECEPFDEEIHLTHSATRNAHGNDHLQMVLVEKSSATGLQSFEVDSYYLPAQQTSRKTLAWFHYQSSHDTTREAHTGVALVPRYMENVSQINLLTVVID